MNKCFDESKIEKDILTFSIFSIYDTDFNNQRSIYRHLDEILNLYENYNHAYFFTNPFFEELTKYYVNGYNYLNSKQYDEIVSYCEKKLKIYKYESNNYFSKVLYSYYNIIENDKNVDDKTFNAIINTYIHFADFCSMEKYILNRLLLNKNNITDATYLNFIKRLGLKLYNKEMKNYNKTGILIFSNINDEYYSSITTGRYIYDNNKIILFLGYIKKECFITNLQTIFHEINHAKQYNDDDYYNYNKNQMLKDIFLQKVLKNKYDINYWFFSHEYDAEYNARNDIINFVKKYTNRELILPAIEYEKSALRVYNNKVIHIDLLFNSVIKKHLLLFQKNYRLFNLEYDKNGNRYLISHFIIQKYLSNDIKIIKYYNDLIYKHCYSYKEIMINIKDLMHLIKNSDECVQEYKRVLYDLINNKLKVQIFNNVKNIEYKGKTFVKKIFGIK